MTWRVARKVHMFAVLLIVPTRLFAQALTVGTDPRVELLSIVFHLAGLNEYNQGAIPSYNHDVDKAFGAFRDHPVVRIARDWNAKHGVGFDAVISLAIHLTPPPGLLPREPLTVPGIDLDKRWRSGDLTVFLAALRDFASTTHFETFYSAHRDLYMAADSALAKVVEAQIRLSWFGSFFGQSAHPLFFVVPGMLNGGQNYGPRFTGKDSGSEVWSINGVSGVDSLGRPSFDANLAPLIVHEFAHSFVNPAVAVYADALNASAQMVYDSVAAQMQSQAYSSPLTMVDESIVRAIVVRYRDETEDSAAAAEQLASERRNGFVWLDGLVSELRSYEVSRANYPTFESFLPRLVAYYQRLPADIGAILAAYRANQPRLVESTPRSGDTHVDKMRRTITLRFDRRMTSHVSLNNVPGAPSDAYPPIIPPFTWDSTHTTLTLRLKSLLPSHKYAFEVTGRSFRSIQGYPPVPLDIHFETGP